MFLIIGILIGLNLAVRVVLSEAREFQTKGRAGFRGQTRLTVRDVGNITVRGAIFLLAPVAIGLVLDVIFGTTVGQIFAN